MAWPRPAVRTSLLGILRECGRIGAISFGSGRQLYFLDTFVRRLGWVSMDQFADGLAISQLLPGPNISNLAVYLGWLMHGWRGALLAWVALLLPGLAVIVAAAAVLRSGQYPDVLNGALLGVAAVGVALLLAFVIRTAPATNGRARHGAAIAVGTFLLAGPLGVGLVPSLLLFGGLSLWLNRPGLVVRSRSE